MIYVFDEEGREMPVREIEWDNWMTVFAIILALGLAAAGVYQYCLNRASVSTFIALAGQQAKTAERVKVLEWRVTKLDSLRMVWEEESK